MRSEQRHELQHNELAEWLFQTGEQLKPHQNLILAAVAVLGSGRHQLYPLVATRRQPHRSRLDRVESGDGDRQPEAFAAIAEEYANTIVGQTAAAVFGDLRLAAACDRRFVRRQSPKGVESRQESYEKILEDNLSSALRERATYGMARVRRSLEIWTPPSSFMATSSTKWPHSAFAAAAKHRLADFKNLEIKLMFNDLRKHEPKGEFADEPGSSLTPPTRRRSSMCPRTARRQYGGRPPQALRTRPDTPFPNVLGKGLDGPTPTPTPDNLITEPDKKLLEVPPARPAPTEIGRHEAAGRRVEETLTKEKGTGPICRNGPEGARTNWTCPLFPFPPRSSMSSLPSRFELTVAAAETGCRLDAFWPPIFPTTAASTCGG